MRALGLRLDLPSLPPAAEALREEVRAFIDEERAACRLPPPVKVGMGFSVETTKRIAGEAGYIG